mmetsp:Transcript_19857/g.29620  ORF Transcript_19857/g.29620 Transcript_19857/m.29620 type:complete len:121 (+) Transcript_19857:597-959(+)
MLLCKTFLDFPMLRFQFFIAGDTFLFLMTFSPVFWESKRRGHVLIFEMRISEWERDRKDSRSGAVDLQLVGIGCRVGVCEIESKQNRESKKQKVETGTKCKMASLSFRLDGSNCDRLSTF